MTCSLTQSVYGFILMEKFRILLAPAINPYTIETSIRKHHPKNLCTMKKKIQKCWKCWDYIRHIKVMQENLAEALNELYRRENILNSLSQLTNEKEEISGIVLIGLKLHNSDWLTNKISWKWSEYICNNARSAVQPDVVGYVPAEASESFGSVKIWRNFYPALWSSFSD